MNYFDEAVHQAARLAAKFPRHRGDRGRSQTVTICRSQEEIDRFWRDPEKLSQVLGGIATVRSPERDVFEWTLPVGETLHTRLLDSTDGLRYVADPAGPDNTGARAEMAVTYLPAPKALGTEVTLEATTPFPDFLTGAALFTILYRARALLQTGEVPTLSHNPSARRAAH